MSLLVKKISYKHTVHTYILHESMVTFAIVNDSIM